ncbi:MAG: ribonuclease VapC [Candidatus Binatia bacterium]|nr:MAG: ribonuclease VapC [Candidatus Binatia bacterium]
MRLLLDTHVWIWSLLEPTRLGRRALSALRNRRSELWLSPVSTWEFLILVERGRVQIDAPPEDWLRDAMERAPLREAPLTHEIALASRSVDLPHDDPADRFLAATARVLDLTLVTADRRMMRSRSFSVLPAN